MPARSAFQEPGSQLGSGTGKSLPSIYLISMTTQFVLLAPEEAPVAVPLGMHMGETLDLSAKKYRCGLCYNHLWDNDDNENSACGLCVEDFVRVLDQLNTMREDKISELHQLSEELEYRNTELKDSKAFLRLQFDSEKAEGISIADVEILVRDKTNQPIYAHKLVLANRSPVFRKMFESEMMESKTGILHIDDATLPVIRAVIQFCYHAEIDFTEEVTAEDVLPVAHKDAIDLLQKKCEEHLIKTIDKVNLPIRLQLAEQFEAKELEEGALTYLRNHYDIWKVFWKVIMIKYLLRPVRSS